MIEVRISLWAAPGSNAVAKAQLQHVSARKQGELAEA